INSSRFWWEMSCRALAVFSASSSDFDASSEGREFSRKRTLFGLIWFPQDTGYTFSGAGRCRFSPPIAAEICAKQDVFSAALATRPETRQCHAGKNPVVCWDILDEVCVTCGLRTGSNHP